MPVTEQATTPNTIVLIGNGRHEEFPAAGAITPGDCVKMAAAGTVTAGLLANGELLIAKEDALQGKTVDDAYASGDVVFTYIPVPGDVLSLRAAATQTIAVGAKCGINAGGQVASAGVGLVALSAVTSSTLGDRIKVRVAPQGQASA